MKVVDFFKKKKSGGTTFTSPTSKRKKYVNFIGIKPVKQKKIKISKKNMNWFQAKAKYPKLSPWTDSDKDGLINMFDCKPFNKRKKDVPHNPSPVKPVTPPSPTHPASPTPLGRPALGAEQYTKSVDVHGHSISQPQQTQKSTPIPAQTQQPVKAQAQVSTQAQAQPKTQPIQQQAQAQTQKLYGGMTAEQRYASTVQALKTGGELYKPTVKGIVTSLAFETKPAFTAADPFKLNTALTYAGQLIQAIPGSKLTGFSKQEAEQKRQDIMKRAYTEYSYDAKTGKEIGKITPGMTVAQKVGAVLEPTYKTAVGQNLLVTAAALPVGYAVGTVLKGVPTVVSAVSPKATQAIAQAVSSPVGQTVLKTAGTGLAAYGGYKAVAEPTIKAYKEGKPSGEVLGTAVTKGLGYGGALALGAEGAKLGLKYGLDVAEAGKQIVTGKIPLYHGTSEANFQNIKKEGLKPGTYLAQSKEEAEAFLRTRYGNANVDSGEGLKIAKVYFKPSEIKEMAETSRDAGNILTLKTIEPKNLE